MINWIDLIINSIWISALAFALKVVSIAYWESQRSGRSMRVLLKLEMYTFPLNLSGALFCSGMALTSEKWWEITLWIVLMLLFGIQSWVYRSDQKGKSDADDEQVVRE